MTKRKQMSEKTLRAGIIGCGGISQGHIDGYRKNNAKITALTDINKAVAEEKAKDLNGAKCFDDYRSLLESGLVDVVSICTPPVAHEEAAVFALERNIHVLCEKPLAHSVKSGRKIMAAAEKSEALLMTAFRHRFLPAIRKMREMIDEGKIGPVVFFHNTFCGPAFKMKDKWFSKKAVSGGGTLMDTSIHSVDIFRYLVGEVVDQKAVMHRHLEGIDVEDTSILILKAENGAIGSLTASWVAGTGMAVIDITGQDGRMIFEYSKEIRLKRRDEKEWNIIPVESSGGFTEEIAHLIKAIIRGEKNLSCTGKDGLRALEIVQANY